MKEFTFNSLKNAESFRNRATKIHLIIRVGNRFAVVLPRYVSGRTIVS